MEVPGRSKADMVHPRAITRHPWEGAGSCRTTAMMMARADDDDDTNIQVAIFSICRLCIWFFVLHSILYVCKLPKTGSRMNRSGIPISTVVKTTERGENRQP